MILIRPVLALWMLLALLVTSAASCPSGLSAQLRTGDAETLLEAHNRWRVTHQALPLTWSDELSRYAQAWAEWLVASHPGQLMHSGDGGSARTEALERGYQGWGENLYWHSAILWSDGRRQVRRDLTGEDVVESWAREVRWYDFATGDCAPEADPGCGHFTQVVWQKTTAVGCGRALGADSAQVWACSYDPPGNYRGQFPVNVLAPTGR